MVKFENIDKSLYTDREIQYAIFGFILLPLYIKFMYQLSVVIPFPTSITTVLYYGVIWFFIIKYILINFRSATFNLIQLCILNLLFCLFCMALGSTGSKYIFSWNSQELITFQPKTLFFTSMYMFFGISVQDYDSFIKRLHIVARIGVVLGLLIYCIGLVSRNLIYYDDMNYAYSLCLAVCSLIACYTRKDILFIIGGVLCLLLAGTRGPLVCITVAFLLKAFIGKKNVKVILGRAALCVFVIVVLYSGAFTWILNKLISALGRFDVTQLRILDYMNEGMLLDSSGRDGFYDIIIDAIKNKPLIGHGIGADRMILPRGSYCHNIILEIMVSLGVVFGTVIIVWIFYRTLQMFIKGGESCKIIAIAYLSGEIVKLFLSASILQSVHLFIFLGMSLVATGRIKWKKQI